MPIPKSEIAHEVLQKTELSFQDVSKSAMQAYIICKAEYVRKAKASKLKQAEYIYFLQPKADH